MCVTFGFCLCLNFFFSCPFIYERATIERSSTTIFAVSQSSVHCRYDYDDNDESARRRSEDRAEIKAFQTDDKAKPITRSN